MQYFAIPVRDPRGSIFSHSDLLLLTRITAHARGLIELGSTHARYIECLATANAAATITCKVTPLHFMVLWYPEEEGLVTG